VVIGAAGGDSWEERHTVRMVREAGVKVVVRVAKKATGVDREDFESKYNHSVREEVISMPGRDRTGPMGYGPKTGRGAGLCTDNPSTNVPGRGFGVRAGRGRGFRGGDPFFQSTPQEERSFLETQMEVLQNGLNSIKQRLEELSAKVSD